VYEQDYEFKIGQSICLREGSDITIIANGTMVYESLEAAKILDASGVSVSVINMHTVKPLDKEAIGRAMQSKLIVTVEEHSVIGGLGAAVAEYKATLDGAPPQLILGLPDKFGKTADYRYLLESYGLVAQKIANSILDRVNK
jgi:transketolase